MHRSSAKYLNEERWFMDEAKRLLVHRWMVKAFRDLKAAERLSSTADPYLDVAIYHCQQAAEKCVKGLLVYNDQRVKKTHNVSSLVQEAARFYPHLNILLDAAELLTPYAEEYRYPDEALDPSRMEFTEAHNAAVLIFRTVTSVLPSETISPAWIDDYRINPDG